jgi:putative membrane-bound dehydrogenase-like protein
MTFPTAQQLENTDVLVIFAADGMKVVGEQRASFEKYLQRGGGLVVVHDGVVSDDQHEWAKKVQGGAWIWARNAPGKTPTKWFEGEVGICFVGPKHPITSGVSNFDWKDEIYYDLDMSPEVQVLATSFHSVFVIAPQLWTYEKTWDGGTAPYRAFVSLPGHEYDSFNTPHYRALLLRGIAWAGKRSNADEFCKPEELASLKYPAGGPTAPEKAAAKLNANPDFDISLVVSEPLVEKVISLDWDPQGRLWVAETPEYPNGRTINRNDNPINPDRALHPDNYRSTQENRPARDRVSWLEDTNGDGRMDKKHVFYEGLEKVTSLVFYKDGVIVAQAPDILWLRDTNGDGQADKVEKVFTGFGINDTHAVINNFRWGLDGWIYSAIGYSAGRPTSADGTKDFGRVTAGVIRFKPDGSALEQYASGSCNTWGFDFAPDGEAFYTTATCGEHLLHIVMPEKVLARGNVIGTRASSVVPDHQKVFPALQHTRPAYIQIDWVGMFTAAAGSCIYNGGAWPDRFNGTHFLSETTVNLVHNDWLKPQGVTYVAGKEPGREENEFIAGADLWFRPVHTRVGPDGALYVVDFYNQAAIHNDTRGPAHGAHNAATRPDRDHHFARVWRVQHKQAKVLPPWKLDQNDPVALVKMIGHPNGWVRDTAVRLLREKGGDGAVPALKTMVKAANLGAPAQIAALNTLNSVGQLDDAGLISAVNDADPIVRKNALRIAAERDNSGSAEKLKAVADHLNDSDPRARLNALIALGSFASSPEVARAVVSVWPDLKDKYLESAALGVAAKDPLVFVEAAFGAKDPAFVAPFVSHVVRLLANRQDATLAASLAALLAKQPANTDGLKEVALESLAANLRPGLVPTWSVDLQAAFKSLLNSQRPSLPGAALPLIARWDKDGALKPDLTPVITSLGSKLQDASLSDEQRGQVAVNLLGVRNLDSGIVANVAKLLGSSASSALQKRVIDALGLTGDAGAGASLIAAYTKIPTDLHEALFGTIVKRADWTQSLVQALADRKIDLAVLGPANLHRLRTHSDKAVATKANEVIDALKGPEQKQKDALVVQFKPEVEKPGNLENGHKLFTANCAGCHVFKNEGRNIAPNLTGMGAHGAGELLVHIIDPNRLVEPNFVSASIETKDDLTYDGTIERENNAEIILRNASGDFTIRKDNVKSRRSTGRSLMPEGFEALGADGLRDLLGYICADENRFRILDLTPAFTANSSRGLYASEESREQSLRFQRFGMIKVGDIPFDIISPAKSPTGNNVVVLKGGSGFAKTRPQRVEAKAGFAARKLHFLGGVGGWAYPYGGENAKEKPAAKVTLQFADGSREDIILRNGVEIADYIGSGPTYDVPGSKRVPDVVQRGQVRWFSKDVTGRGVIERIALESYDSAVAPTFVAITAELAGAEGNRPVASPSSTTGGPNSGVTKVLIVGGGSSHDFERWFNVADTKMLSATGKFAVKYTDQVDTVLPALKEIDVLNLCLNKAFNPPGLREGIFEFANAGKGLVLVHAAGWYNWPDWPEYNRVLISGGSRGHDRLGEFEVTVTEPGHPVMANVPATFTIRDELYNFIPDEKGSERQVLATGKSPNNGKVHPVVWITKHPKARIVCITLGHDDKAHDLPAYQTLLQNALIWAAKSGSGATAPK